MSDSNNITIQIRSMIIGNFPQAAALPTLEDDSSLLNSGIIDSMGVLDLIMQLEDHFGIALSEEDLVPEHFESIAALAAFVKAKLQVEYAH